MKKLFTMLAMLMLVLQYSMAGEATLTLNGSAESDPKGFFTCAGSFNNKFNGAEYAGTNFTKGLKMDSSGKVTFTTTKVSTVTIVQSTWLKNNVQQTIKFDGNELSIANATAGTGYLVYTLTDVAAGDHSITKGSDESGLFYVKVEWVDAYTATYNNTKGWTDVYAYAWVGNGTTDAEKLLGAWPGKKLTAGDDGKYLVEISNTRPEMIIFNDGVVNEKTDDLKFVNGAEYNSDGSIVNKTAYTATFTTEAEWEHVYAYCWNSTQGEEALGDWPGTEITADAQGVYAISLEAVHLPEGILFNDGNGTQTPDYVFANGAAFAYNKNTYTVTFTTDAGWENVYAWAWSGTGDNTVNHCAPWPGTELTAEEGVYTFEYKAFSAPEKILFNGGDDTKKTPDWTFTDGKAYKYITATPIYALGEGDTFTAGTTVNVKDADDDVVATITYGVKDGKDFNAAVAASVEGYLGYGFYTAGNDENGSATGGTLYTINPLYAGTISVAVRLNGGKKFYIQENGESMEGYDGITIPEAANVVYSFPVKAGSTYKIYCTGSKLGFFGFDYKFEKTVTDYYLMGGTDNWVLNDAALNKDGDVYSVEIPYESGYSFAIVPNTAVFENEINWKSVIRPESQKTVIFENATGSAVTGDGSQNWKMRALEYNESNDYTVTLKYNATENTWAIECAATVKISDVGYATYSNANAYKVSGAEVYTVSDATTKATFNKLAKGAELPGGTGVILKGSGEVTITPSAGTAEIGTNLLKGSGDYSYTITTYDAVTYIFQNGGNGVGFYKVDNLDALPEADRILPAHKAFLKVSGGQAPFFGFDGNGTTGINSVDRGALSVEGCYTLDGRRVEQPTKGLYIMNGKKVLVK